MQEKNACGRIFFQFATRPFVLLDGPHSYLLWVSSVRQPRVSPGGLMLDCSFTFAFTFILFQGAFE